jgi:hypothetical protein
MAAPYLHCQLTEVSGREFELQEVPLLKSMFFLRNVHKMP